MADLGAEIILLILADEVYVAPVALQFALAVLVGAEEIHRVGVERVGFDAADKLEAGITHVVIARALFPKVEVVGEQTGDAVVVFHRPFDRLIGWTRNLARQIDVLLFERPPAAFEEFVAPGVDVAACRHAGGGAAVAIIKDGAAFYEAIHIGCRHRPVGRLGAPALV